MMRKFKIAVLAAMFCLATNAMAGDSKNLIELEGGKPVAGLAKSWAKVKDGEYTFELDTAAELKKGVTVSAKAVKDSLESKLGTTYGVKVTEKSPSSVSVAYTCDEPTFLEQISKTRIREKSVELALESSVSEGGIRARVADREPQDGEVKVIVTRGGNGKVTGKVVGSKSTLIKNDEKVTVAIGKEKLKKSERFFFIPDQTAKGIWTAKKDTVLPIK